MPPCAWRLSCFVARASAVLKRCDGDLPCSTAFKRHLAFVDTVPFFGERRDDIHRGHAHFRHARHVAANADLSARNGRAIGGGQFHAIKICSLLRSLRLG